MDEKLRKLANFEACLLAVREAVEKEESVSTAQGWALAYGRRRGLDALEVEELFEARLTDLF